MVILIPLEMKTSKLIKAKIRITDNVIEVTKYATVHQPLLVYFQSGITVNGTDGPEMSLES
jgi:hypothetical protein